MGIELPEYKNLVTTAEKARFESREVLELLRNYTGDGRFLPHLRDYLAHLKQDANLNYVMEAPNNSLQLEPKSELELLRICQEALNNTRLHAAASCIKIVILKKNRHIEISIKDDGVGFDSLAYYRNDDCFRGNGLKVMHERAQSIGAHCRVLSMPNHGTEVLLEVPVKR